MPSMFLSASVIGHQYLGVLLSAAHGASGAEVPSMGEIRDVHNVANVAAALVADHDRAWMDTYRSGLDVEGQRLVDSMLYAGRSVLHSNNPEAAAIAGITPPGPHPSQRVRATPVHRRPGPLPAAAKQVIAAVALITWRA
jgi:hypothetical protein